MPYCMAIPVVVVVVVVGRAFWLFGSFPRFLSQDGKEGTTVQYSTVQYDVFVGLEGEMECSTVYVGSST